LPSWETAVAEDWLGKWAMNQMLINVSTRKFKRSVRLPEGGVPSPAGSGLSKSAVSRRFVALSAAHMKKWLASDLSGLDLLVVQIDGIHMDEDMTLVAAIGVDAKGDKHPLGLAEGATESAATVQALRLLPLTQVRLFVVGTPNLYPRAPTKPTGPRRSKCAPKHTDSSIRLSLQPSPSSDTSAFSRMRAFVSSWAERLPLRVNSSSWARSSPSDGIA
jgi:hypothetical protein